MKKSWATLDVFDATQFKQVIDQKGYQFETNHAFMPLFAYFVAKLHDFSRLDTVLVGHLYQFAMQYINSVLLYL